MKMGREGKKMGYRQGICVVLAMLAASLAATAQETSTSSPSEADAGTTPVNTAPAYKPKFPGDPARSESEALALGYMRTVLRAQKDYKKKNGKFANSLPALIHTGSFTRRMVDTDRGDYTVGFKAKREGFVLTLTPKELAPERRSFYADEDGKIHADEEKAADDSSPTVS